MSSKLIKLIRVGDAQKLSALTFQKCFKFPFCWIKHENNELPNLLYDNKFYTKKNAKVNKTMWDWSFQDSAYEKF